MNRRRTKIIILWIVAVLLLASCGGNPGNTGASPSAAATAAPSAQQEKPSAVSPGGSVASPSAPQEQAGSGTLGSHKVSILNYTLAEDYEGKPAAVITYEWTNNSDKTMNFMFALQYQLFQNGIECQSAILTDTDGYDADTQLTDIRPGTTLTVQSAFVLQDKESPIEVEVSELMSYEADPPKVKKTFEIV
jgi:hypothetical protein